MKFIIPLLLLTILLVGCSPVQQSNINVGAGIKELPDAKPISKCLDSEISIQNNCLKVREPTKLNGGIVTVDGDIIISGHDIKEVEFPEKCCRVTDKNLKDCACVYGDKKELAKKIESFEMLK